MTLNYSLFISCLHKTMYVCDAGVIDWWNGSNTTDYFGYPCNVVEGSAGELWPPGQERDKVSLFSPDLCMWVSVGVAGWNVPRSMSWRRENRLQDILSAPSKSNVNDTYDYDCTTSHDSRTASTPEAPGPAASGAVAAAAIVCCPVTSHPVCAVVLGRLVCVFCGWFSQQSDIVRLFQVYWSIFSPAMSSGNGRSL